MEQGTVIWDLRSGTIEDKGDYFELVGTYGNYPIKGQNIVLDVSFQVYKNGVTKSYSVFHEENNYTIEHIETIVGRETTIATFSTTAKIISSILFLTAVYYPLKRKEN